MVVISSGLSRPSRTARPACPAVHPGMPGSGSWPSRRPARANSGRRRGVRVLGLAQPVRIQCRAQVVECRHAPLLGRSQELQGSPRDVRRRVRVPGQLDGDQAAVAAVGEGAQHRREVDLAGAELEVLVHAPAHVVDLHVDQVLGDVGDAVRHAHRLQAPAVSDVEGQPEPVRRAQGRPAAAASPRCPAPASPAPARTRPGSPDAARPARRTPSVSRFQAVSSSTPAGLTPAQQDTASAPRSAPMLAARRRKSPALVVVVVQEGRRVLVPRVEQVARPGLDHHRRGRGRAAGRRRGPPRRARSGRERVQVVVVQGQRHALIAEVGDDGERVGRAGGWRTRWCRSRTAARSCR